jgi:hypothetical protein
VKMKVGREPERDVQRVRVAREAIGHKRLDEKSGLALIDPAPESAPATLAAINRPLELRLVHPRAPVKAHGSRFVVELLVRAPLRPGGA